MLERIRARNEWKFFAVLPRADAPLAIAWWFILVLRGVLPALFAIAMGALVEAVQQGATLGTPLALAAVVFLLFQVLPPLHQAAGANLGDRTAAWLYDRLTGACVEPPGMGHLEDPALLDCEGAPPSVSSSIKRLSEWGLRSVMACLLRATNGRVRSNVPRSAPDSDIRLVGRDAGWDRCRLTSHTLALHPGAQAIARHRQ